MTKTTETIAAEKTETSGIDDEETAEFLICRMDDTFYAFYTTDIERVRPYIHITFVPGCPYDYVANLLEIQYDDMLVMMHELSRDERSDSIRK